MDTKPATTPDLSHLTTDELRAYFGTLLDEAKQRLECPLYKLFPAEGGYALSKYPKHSAFITATKTSPIVYFRAANRVGKTVLAAWMTAIWATGLYPAHWDGWVCDHAPTIWVAGVTSHVVYSVFQHMLDKSALDPGDGGFIPHELIVNVSKKSKPQGAYNELEVRHVPSGRDATIVFKSYEEGVDTYQGKKVDIILLDEEPPMNIFSECLVRIMSGKSDGKLGRILITATPLKGRTPFVRSFEADEGNTDRVCINATWDDVPHLSEEEKAIQLRNMAPHLIEARTKGIPYLGSGMVFPVSPDRYTHDGLYPIPKHYKLINGLDTGLTTFAVFGAIDPVTQTLYIYGEREFKDVPIPIKAHALSQISYAPYMADTSNNRVNEYDNRAFREAYDECGLTLVSPNKKLKDIMVAKVYAMMVGGQIQISRDCRILLQTLQGYHRVDGRIVKEEDHAVDALLYLVQGWHYAMSSAEIQQAFGAMVAAQMRLRSNTTNNSGWV